jgi:uncharacterized repeat protein (TIGR03803 family)
MHAKSPLLASVVLLAIAAQAQYQYTVLHAFGSGDDGAGVWSSVVFDSQGNLYGTTSGGGAHQAGTVYELTPQEDGNWTEAILYNFLSSPSDGAGPFGGVTVGPGGNLYGTTQVDGNDHYGTVYELSPGLGGWTETVLYNFCSRPGCSDGGSPYAGVIVDKAGNLYGTAHNVYELSPAPANWAENVLHNFTGTNGDGYFPQAAPIMDAARNIYGTTLYGGGGGCDDGCGTVYQLETPIGAWSKSPGWREHILHRFGEAPDDGAFPGVGELAIDGHGNLYGTADTGGTGRGGIVYKLVRTSAAPGGVWAEVILHNFAPDGLGYEPGGGVIIDSAGNLYGTTINGGSPFCGCGVVYKLSPQPDGQWQYTLLHTFVGSDGAQPDANLTIGPDGNLYGTAAAGGTFGGGVVFQIQIAP